jgi:hypothetical protein
MAKCFMAKTLPCRSHVDFILARVQL